MTKNLDIDGIIKEYFGENELTPFIDAAEERNAWCSFLDMLCMTALLLKEEGHPLSLQRVGSLLKDEELIKALEPHRSVDFAGVSQYFHVFQTLIKRERDGNGMVLDLPMAGFICGGMLDYIEVLAFVMAAATDFNRKYERIFGILKEENGKHAKPTFGLVMDLAALCLPKKQTDFTCLWDEDSFFNRFLTEPVHFEEGASRLSRILSLNKRTVQILSGQPLQLGALSCCAKTLSSDAPMEDFLCHENEFKELVRVFTMMASQERQGIVELYGEDGIGKSFLMHSLGMVAELNVLSVDLRKFLAAEDSLKNDLLKDMILKCVCEKMILYLENVPLEKEAVPTIQRVFGMLQDYLNVIFIGSKGKQPAELSFEGDWYTISLELPGMAVQKTFWEYFLKKNRIVLSEDISLDQLVSRYYMTPGRISQVLSNAFLNGEPLEHGVLVSRALLEQQIRMKCSAEFGNYATRIESPFTWEDLQVAKDSEEQLRAACDRVRYRSIVNDTFGFGRKLPYGGGTSIVLYGPPGTGKTMAAQVLAHELGLDIYRIDLSQIGSKYIGETEKNLAAVFDAAKFSNAILFFDEADALFAKRTEVTSSNDKHANAETAYLLQKIEEYSGVSILATNIMQNFDNAFKRRMTFMIPIEQPDEAARLSLWKKVFPASAPLEDDIDFTIYAKYAELTGSNIKSAALSAAYRAASKGRSIRNEDLIEAIDFEYRRTGRLGIKNELYSLL